MSWKFSLGRHDNVNARSDLPPTGTRLVLYNPNGENADEAAGALFRILKINHLEPYLVYPGLAMRNPVGVGSLWPQPNNP